MGKESVGATVNRDAIARMVGAPIVSQQLPPLSVREESAPVPREGFLPILFLPLPEKERRETSPQDQKRLISPSP